MKHTAIITRLQRDLNGRLEERAHEAFGDNYRAMLTKLVARHTNKSVGDAANHIMKILAFKTLEKSAM